MISAKYANEVFQSRSLPDNLISEIRLSDIELSHLSDFLKFNISEINSDVFEEYYEVLLWLSPKSFVFYLGILIQVTIRDNAPAGLAIDLILQILGSGATEFARNRFDLLSRIEIDMLEQWIFWISESKSDATKDDFCLEALVQIEKIWK